MPFREKLRESAKLIPCLLLIAAVFLSLLLGWATATECAAWGVLGSLRHRWWRGTLTWKALLARASWARRALTCMIMLILAGAAFMSTSMAYTGIPAALADWVEGLDLRPICADRRADLHVHRPGHAASTASR